MSEMQSGTFRHSSLKKSHLDNRTRLHAISCQLLNTSLHIQSRNTEIRNRHPIIRNVMLRSPIGPYTASMRYEYFYTPVQHFVNAIYITLACTHRGTKHLKLHLLKTNLHVQLMHLEQVSCI